MCNSQACVQTLLACVLPSMRAVPTSKYVHVQACEPYKMWPAALPCEAKSAHFFTHSLVRLQSQQAAAQQLSTLKGKVQRFWRERKEPFTAHKLEGGSEEDEGEAGESVQ